MAFALLTSDVTLRKASPVKATLSGVAALPGLLLMINLEAKTTMKKTTAAILFLTILNTAFIGYHIYATQFDLGCITDQECEDENDQPNDD